MLRSGGFLSADFVCCLCTSPLGATFSTVAIQSKTEQLFWDRTLQTPSAELFRGDLMFLCFLSRRNEFLRTLQTRSAELFHSRFDVPVFFVRPNEFLLALPLSCLCVCLQALHILLYVRTEQRWDVGAISLYCHKSKASFPPSPASNSHDLLYLLQTRFPPSTFSYIKSTHDRKTELQTVNTIEATKYLLKQTNNTPNHTFLKKSHPHPPTK